MKEVKKVENEKVYVTVILWQGCIDSVFLDRTKDEAKAHFKAKTGVDYDDAQAAGDDRYGHEDWFGSDIFALTPGKSETGNAPGRGH